VEVLAARAESTHARGSSLATASDCRTGGAVFAGRDTGSGIEQGGVVWRPIGVLLLAWASVASAAETAGFVKIANGTVSIERAGDRQAATAGTPVLAGDRIVTGRDSSVGITLRDNTLLSAGADSVLVIDKFLFNSTTHAGEIDASVKRGSVAVISGKIAKQSPDTVRFRTPNAVLGVRGTAFVIDVGDAEAVQ